MTALRPAVLAAVSAACVLTPWASFAQDPVPVMPPAATRPVDFSTEVVPILRASCTRCHARGREKGGFSIESRDRLLKGGDDGPAIVPGDSAASHLVALVSGLDPDEVMPKKGTRLTAAQIGILRAWIDGGAAWDPSVSFARTPPQNLARRLPDVPPAVSHERHPIDRLLARYFAAHDVTLAPAAGERRLVRRLYLDAIGLLPPPSEVERYVADRTPGKTAALVTRLLADDRDYAAHWLSLWNDLLRNDYRGTGYIDGGRKQVSAWLYAALASDMPYDRFVAALVNPVPATEGFTKGIVWRGVVNASQTPEMQAAQNISQVFMGVNLKCASCHDSFINDWQLADAYGLAGVYAAGPLQMVECDRPTGRYAPLKFLYDGLGTIDAAAPRPVRLEQLAQALAGPANGRLSRTIVNRLWARFMGRGLVEPVDDMDQPSWAPDLIDWLAEDLVTHGYDLRRTISLILTSEVYRRQAIDGERPSGAYVFHGPTARRMSAEQFVDAISAVTGVWQDKPAGEFDFTLVSEQARPAPRRTRAALVNATPLMTALGRPNREQVVTTRTEAATTLQALELTNGATLAASLRAGAEHLLASFRTGDEIVRIVFTRALGRTPTRDERALSLGLLGAHPSVEGVEDLLWSIVMLPEFQMVS